MYALPIKKQIQFSGTIIEYSFWQNNTKKNYITFDEHETANT